MSERSSARGAAAAGRIEDWPAGPQAPLLIPGSVHVWGVDLDAVADAVLEALSRDERERAAGIAGERDGARWSRSRGVLRELLARYTAGEADAVELRIESHGKPELSRPGGRDLFFNVSHSRNLALYAFCADGPVGVDIQARRAERARADVDHIALARRAFGEHEAQRLMLVVPERREREFLRAWTRHEAELKRLGTGIGVCRRDGGQPDRGSAAGSTADPRAAPSIVELDVGPEAAAALALQQSPNELQLWAWA
jgi:4'-phosphopantetheinyl transferase